MSDGAERDDEGLSANEVRVALAALTRTDLKRLERLALQFVGGTGVECDDLVEEAVAAILSTRTCRRGVPLLVCLGGAIRSIASAKRKAVSRSAVVPFPFMSAGEVDPMINVADLAPTVEASLVTAENDAADIVVLQRINEALADDYRAQLCLAGWSEGYRGSELREFVEVNQKTLDYLGKKIRRAAYRLYPDGWPS